MYIQRQVLTSTLSLQYRVYKWNKYLFLLPIGSKLTADGMNSITNLTLVAVLRVSEVEFIGQDLESFTVEYAESDMF